MSVPLKDAGRLAIKEATHMWLEAEAIAFGKTMQEVVREVLEEWAKKKAHAFKVAHRRLASNGLQTDWLGEDTEEDGIETADAGTQRSARK